MNTNILKDITYGMYIVTGNYKEEMVGCVVNTVCQITSESPVLAVSINKNNYTNKVLKKSKRVAISILSEKTSKETIVKFGYYTSKEVNKFENINYKVIDAIPIIFDNICGYVTGEIINIIDVNTHDIFLINITKSEKINNNKPMTYEYYQNTLKGTSPKNAPTYVTSEKDSNYNQYECIICGHIYDESKEKIKFEDLPDDWKCPVCGVGKDKFKKLN